MSTFSQRYGYKSSVLQLETASDTLKRRILAAFYKQEFDSYDTIDWTNYTTGIEDMVKYLLTWSNAAVVPPRRALTIPAAGL